MDGPPGTLRKVIGDNVRRRRTELRLSQEGLADACGLHRTYVGSIERAERNVSIDNIEKISAALGIEGWSLLKNP